MAQQNYPNISEFYEDFEKDSQMLGQGTFGVVYKLKTKRILNQEVEKDLVECFKGQYYAVKMMEASSVQSFEQIQKEFLILRVIPKHPNIINLIKTYAWQKTQPVPTYTLVLVMELADRSLLHEIESRKMNGTYFTEEELLFLFKQCFDTFQFLIEKQNIFHRDIKPENILLTQKDSLQLKISDFGVSKRLLEEKFKTIHSTLVGSPVFLSPILWAQFEKGNFQLDKIGKVQHNLEKSDVYSLGITLLQCSLLLKNEVIGLNQGKIGQQKTEHLLSNIKSQRIQQILRRMLEHEEKNRASYQELIQNFFVSTGQFPQNLRAMTPSRPMRQHTDMLNTKEKLSTLTSKNSSSERKQVNTNKQSNGRSKYIFTTHLQGNLLPPSKQNKQHESSFDTIKSSRGKIEFSQSLQQQDGNFCPKHHDKIVQYYCYSGSFRNFCCESCFQQLSLGQRNMTITLPQFKQRIKSDQFNNQLQDDIFNSKEQLTSLQKSQDQIIVSTLKNIESKLLEQFTKVLQQSTDEIIQHYRKLQNYNKQFQDSLNNLLIENQRQIDQIGQLNINYTPNLITEVLEAQTKIQYDHERIKKRISKIEFEQDKKIVQTVLDYFLIVRNNLNEKIDTYISKHQCEIVQNNWVDLSRYQHLIQSRFWELEDGRLVLSSDRRKATVQLNYDRDVNRKVEILHLGQSDLLYFQTESLEFYRYNYDTCELQMIEQMKEKINSFVNYNDSIIFGTQFGSVIKYHYNLGFKLLYDKQVEITAMRSVKKGVVCGTSNGCIFTLIEDDIKLQIQDIVSQHQNRIIKFVAFEQFKCLVSVSQSKFLNFHYSQVTKEFDTGLIEINNVFTIDAAVIMAIDYKSRQIKIWSVQLDDDHDISLNIVYQYNLEMMILHAVCLNNLIFVLNDQNLSGLEIEYQAEGTQKFTFEHFEMDKSVIFDRSVSNITTLNSRGILAYACNQRILIWSMQSEN